MNIRTRVGGASVDAEAIMRIRGIFAEDQWADQQKSIQWTGIFEDIALESIMYTSTKKVPGGQAYYQCRPIQVLKPRELKTVEIDSPSDVAESSKRSKLNHVYLIIFSVGPS